MVYAFKEYLSDHIKALKKVEEINYNNIEIVCNKIIECLKDGNSIFCFGNGGSSAEASHFVGELVGRFELSSREPLSAINLNADMTSVTAISNDFGYQHVFSRQVKGLCNSKDILFGLSTSGTSSNILNAFKEGKTIGTINILLTGEGNNLYFDEVDYILKVPSESTAIIQEIHLVYF